MYNLEELEPTKEELEETKVHTHHCELCSTDFACTLEGCEKVHYEVCDICKLEPLGGENA